MLIASDAMAFGQAAKLRDSYKAVERYSLQNMVTEKKVDRDVFALGVDEDLEEACGVLFKIREGKLIGVYRFLKNIGGLPINDLFNLLLKITIQGNTPQQYQTKCMKAVNMTNDEPLIEYLYQEKAKKYQFIPLKEVKKLD